MERDDMLLTRQQLARHFGVCPRTIAAWARKFGWPELRITGPTVRYSTIDIDKTIAELRERGVSLLTVTDDATTTPTGANDDTK